MEETTAWLLGVTFTVLAIVGLIAYAVFTEQQNQEACVNAGGSWLAGNQCLVLNTK